MTTEYSSTRKSLSVRQMLILAAAAIGAFPAFATGLTAYFMSQNNLRTFESQSQQALSIKLANEVSRYINFRLRDVKSWTKLPMFSDPEVVKTIPNNVKEEFFQRVVNADSFSGAALTDLQGNFKFLAGKGIPYNIQYEPFFKQALSSGNLAISNVITSKVNNSERYALRIAVPLKDRVSNATIGMMVANLPLESLKGIFAGYKTLTLKQGQEEPQELLIIAKSTGKFVFTSNEEAFDKPIDTFAFLPAAVKNAQNVVQIVQNPFDTHKHREFLATAPLPEQSDLPPLDIAIATALRLDSLEATERQLLIAIATISLLAAAGLSGLAFFIATRMTGFIQKIAASISESSGDIESTFIQQANLVAEQAVSMGEATESMTELGAISTRTAEQAAASAQSAQQALLLVEEGTRAVQQTKREMTDLQEKVDAIALQIVNLSEQTNQIANVSELVGDLANQTNMLALNAAVEAARAGEQGRGFSVVAAEIRKLADQSKQSATQIGALAEDIQTAINRTVMVTDEGTKKVLQGLQFAENTSTTFIGVNQAIGNLFLTNQQISLSSKQQAISLQQMLTQIGSLSEESKESAVGMHRIKITTQELAQVAKQLKDSVN
jgi:methyl-accepting chemotaxis protein